MRHHDRGKRFGGRSCRCQRHRHRHDGQDDVIANALEELSDKRRRNRSEKLAALIEALDRQFRIFSFKIGKHDDHFVLEAHVPPYTAAAESGRDAAYLAERLGTKLRRNIDPHGVLVMEFGEADFDSAIDELETMEDGDFEPLFEDDDDEEEFCF